VLFRSASAGWNPSFEFPDGPVLSYYNQIKSHCGYFAVCGAKGCIRACMTALEKRKAIGQHAFPTPVFARPKWELRPPEEDDTGGIAEGKYPDLFAVPDTKAGMWE
jgi:epoxyqueuosine reductase